MLGAPVNAYGALASGQMTAQTLQAQANLQQQQAQEAQAAGKYNASREMMLANQKIGTSIAAYGAAGVSQNSGSVQNVLANSAANAELDRLNILHGADVKAINYNNQASMDMYGAASAITGSYWNAAGAITGGAITGLSNRISSNPAGGSGAGGEGAGLDEGAAGSGAGSGYMSAGAGEGAGVEAGGSMSAADAAALA